MDDLRSRTGVALASILLSVHVLAPATRLKFAVLAVHAYEHFVRSEADVSEANRVLAYWNHEAWRPNQAAINRLIGAFGVACGALVVAIVLWSLTLALD